MHGYSQLSRNQLIIFILVFGMVFIGASFMGAGSYMYLNVLVAVGMMGAFTFMQSRVAQRNNMVDVAVHGVVAEFNQLLGGRAHITFVTAHTGLLKPKHTRVTRQIWIAGGGAGIQQTHMGAPPGTYQPGQPPAYGAYPAAAGGYAQPGTGYAAQTQPPGYPLAPPANGHPAPAYPPPPAYQQADPPSAYTTAVGNPFPGDGAGGPSIHREVFYASVPEVGPGRYCPPRHRHALCTLAS